MALPVILIDSVNGSDTLASGAGPTTALTGIAGVSAADGLSVILDGSPDLSGVATDGSHVLYFADATAGGRNFAKITATANSGSPTATVTISDAVGATLTKAWAIGGKRATLNATTTRKLLENNAGNGDAMPGWVVQFASAHVDPLTSKITWRRAGDITSGPIILRGISGAATLPILTSNQNDLFLVMNALGQICQDFECKNTNGTKTASEAIRMSGANCVCRGLRIDNASNFWKGIVVSGAGAVIVSCKIGNTASHGIDNSISGVTIAANYIHNAGGNGINLTNNRTLILNNVIYACTGDGVNTNQPMAELRLIGNTIDACGGDCFECSSATTSGAGGVIVNNILSNSTGGYGINFSNGAQVDAALFNEGLLIRGNDIFGNSLGGATGTNPATITTNEQGSTGNPTFTAASTYDHSIGTPEKAQGWPLGGTKYVGTYSTTYSYIDPGAAQRQESGGAATPFGGSCF